MEKAIGPFLDEYFRNLIVSGPAADRADEREINSQAVRGRVKGIRSVISDHFGYPDGLLAHWPHTRPYGIVVGWTDGHVSYMPLQQRDWAVIGGFNLANADRVGFQATLEATSAKPIEGPGYPSRSRRASRSRR